MADLGVDAVIEISPQTPPRSTASDGGAVGAQPRQTQTRRPATTRTPFARTVASAYEAGLDVSLRGLFAG